MKQFFHLLIIFLALLFSKNSLAQPKPEYTISERKAIKMYEEAIEYYQKRDASNAQKVLLETVNKFPQFAEARFLLAQTYLDQNQAEQAIPHLEEGLKLHPEIFPEAFLILAEEKMASSDYSAASGAASSTSDVHLSGLSG